MQAIPYPQPLTSGGRPPFEPPTSTTYDSSPEESGEPMWRVIAESVKFLLQHVAKAEAWQLPMMLTLCRERRRMVLRELELERMFMPDILPPLLNNMYSLEHSFDANHAIRVYKSLLEVLEEAENELIAKMKDQNIEFPPSDL